MTVNIADGGLAESVDTQFATSEITRGFTTLSGRCTRRRRATLLDSCGCTRSSRLRPNAPRTTKRTSVYSSSTRGRRRARACPGEPEGARGAETARRRSVAARHSGGGRDVAADADHAYQYGDLIHWGPQRDKLEAVKSDRLEDALQRMNFLDAAAGLSHLYMGSRSSARALALT